MVALIAASLYHPGVQDLGQEERGRLFERFGRAFDAGATIYGAGDEPDHCYLIQEGRVRLVKRIRASDRSLTVLRPGDLFGEEALMSVGGRNASALALTRVSVLALDRATFGGLLASSSDVALRLVQQLVRRLGHAEEQLENAMLRDPPSRVVNTLLRLAANIEPGPEGKLLRVSPLELSSRVGLDVDTVKRAVQQLRDEGYLSVREEQIVIPDPDALSQLFELLGMKEDVRGGFV